MRKKYLFGIICILAGMFLIVALFLKNRGDRLPIDIEGENISKIEIGHNTGKKLKTIESEKYNEFLSILASIRCKRTDYDENFKVDYLLIITYKNGEQLRIYFKSDRAPQVYILGCGEKVYNICNYGIIKKLEQYFESEQ